MGIDFLDFTFRIEKRFGIKIHTDDPRMLDAAWTSRNPPDLNRGGTARLGCEAVRITRCSRAVQQLEWGQAGTRKGLG